MADGHAADMICWALLVPRAVLKGAEGEDVWCGLWFHAAKHTNK